MYLDFSSLFHQSSKDRYGQGRVRIPHDESVWPEEWKRVEYKLYPRLPKIALPKERDIAGVFKTIQRRRSNRAFDQRSISLSQMSDLLRFSCGITSTARGVELRAQPSGGHLYPIEVYPIVFTGAEGLPGGVYHYNVREHMLDCLWQKKLNDEDIKSMFLYPWAQKASAAFVLTGVFRRNQQKYGERGYRQILVEAGAILQNIYLIAAELGLRCTAIDAVEEPRIEREIDVDGIDESVIVSLMVG
jgi:SagB-type dehydrogenase family enzyme